MNELTAVIELTNTSVKIVIGYVHEKNVFVIHSSSKKHSGEIVNGKILNKEKLALIIAEACKIKDEQVKLSINISKAVIVLPAIGLDVYSGKKTTNLTSDANKIGPVDVKNVTQLFIASDTPQSSHLLDVIPDMFILDDNSIHFTPPIGQFSRNLTMVAKLQMLPNDIVNSYNEVFALAGLNIEHSVVAPLGIARLYNIPDFPNNFLYIDIGSSITTISVIGTNNLISSSFIFMGGSNLTKEISDAFHIETHDAEKLKRTYGYTNREIGYYPEIISVADPNGSVNKYTIKDLNSVVLKHIDNYLIQVEACLQTLYASDSDVAHLPIYIGGGGSKLHGLLNFFKEKFKEIDVNHLPLTTIGARNPSLLNCVGAIKVVNDYKFKKEIAQSTVTGLSRSHNE